MHPASDGPATSTPYKAGNQVVYKDQYLTPVSFSEETVQADDVKPKETSAHRFVKHNTHSPVVQKDKSTHLNEVVPEPAKARFRRLRSVSCEDLSDYLRNVVYDPVSKSMSDLLSDGDDDGYVLQEPFPRLQTFSGVIEKRHDQELDSYYNIDGLRGKIYDGPGLTVAQIRKRFTKRSQSRIRRSVSNPSFIGSLSVEKLNMARMSIGLMSSKVEDEHHSSSIRDILPDALKRHLNKEGHHKRSHGALSSGAPSSKNSSKHSSRGSSRTNSAQTSPYNSLSRKNKTPNKDEIVATTGVKGINVTKRTRSFRRQKPVESEPVKEREAGELENQSVHHTTNQSEKAVCRGDNNAARKDSLPEETVATKLEMHSDSAINLNPCGSQGSQEHGITNGHKRPTKVFKKPTPAAKPKVVTENTTTC